ncbi:molybdenum ABC transporter ATP-binding protein [Prosthecomicrobium sp. N25]|uniref:molybdenum ABC transporter ATP-binding protein n=1 Tax=Prosthecomicrobium sp. N25 TaxID=3129254 RepID=UPI00307769A3
MIGFACRLARPDFLFDVAFEGGEGVTALFGPSGCGKTTAIRLIAGLERPDRGRIAVDDRVLVDTQAGTEVPAHRRRIGLVFQDAQLFPHLSVRRNLTYGRWFTPAAERRIGLDPVVEVLGIGHLLDRRPATLSGGERQRVAIGRALVASPRLLLMDEPLASLDAARKTEIMPFIERLRDEFRIPIVYVSHAVEEVARLADRVVRLEHGRVAATGTPTEVLAPNGLASATERFEAVSVLKARVRAVMAGYGVTVLSHPAGDIVVPGILSVSQGEVRVAVRATNVTLAVGTPGNLSIRTSLAGRVSAVERGAGPLALTTIALTGGDSLKCYSTRLAVDSLGLDVGDAVLALIKSVSIDERGVPGLGGAAGPSVG